jgi:cysteinyl-tRNA synthetase
LQALVDRGFHPLAFRMLCLQAHYRSELEFSWEGLAAAFTRLKRMVMAVDALKLRGVAPGSVVEMANPELRRLLNAFSDWVSEDLNTAVPLTILDEVLALKKVDLGEKMATVQAMDAVLGLGLLDLARSDLRLRPATATIAETEIEAALAARKEARAAKDFARSDALRDELAAQGVEVMDGDPLGWDWKLEA